jgi:hypothetical protein
MTVRLMAAAAANPVMIEPDPTRPLPAGGLSDFAVEAAVLRHEARVQGGGQRSVLATLRAQNRAPTAEGVAGTALSSRL